MAPMIDATRLWSKFYQGSYPLEGVRAHGFRVLVLCAEELQHRAEEPGVVTLRCPLFDDGRRPMSPIEWQHAVRTGREVAAHAAAGHRTLVTCAQGRNRSGLVAGIALYELSGWSGEQCVQHIQARRRDALTNDDFVAALYGLPPRVRQVAHPIRRAPQRIGPVHQRVGVDGANQGRQTLLRYF
jgi:protein-tyrosine phosphatase